MSRVALASTPNGTIWDENIDHSVVLPTGATAVVYQHGTSNPVSVYTTEGGSGQLTQPLTVNDQGQLPGWVDGPQTVDIIYTIGARTLPAAATPVVPSDIATIVDGGTSA